MNIMSSEGGEDHVIVYSSEASHTPQTMKRSLTSISSDEDSISSQAKRAHLSSDSESDPVFLPDTYESADGESTGEIFISDNEHTQVATTMPAENDLEEIASLLISNCCDRKCMHFLTVHDVLSARDKVNSLNSNALRQWTIDRLNENSHEDASGKIRTKYLVAGNEVCQKAWCNVHEISPARLARLRKSVIKGQKEFEHGNKGKKRSTTTTDGAKAWMIRYFHLVGDKMPHKNQIHLPSWELRKDIYMRYRSDMELQQIPESEMVALSSFYRIWADEFPDVVIPEENRFAKCDICVKLKLDRKSSLNKVQQAELKAKHKEHMQRVERERKKYHSHREKSRTSPDKYMTIIVDGMDQSKTNLPYTKVIAKSTSSLWKLRTHVTGVLVHTKAPCGKLAYAFVDILLWPHDSNLTMTVLYNVLTDYTRSHDLPENLYLQMDNTSRENKNKYILGFCAILVQLKIFKKIQINFLPVGHTHEDVDQLFSKIGEEIRKSGCESLPELLQVITKSSSPNPESKLIDGVWNFKKWMEPYLGIIEKHSKYLVFRFTLNSSGKAELHYKRFSDHPWEPEKDGICVIEGCPDANDKPELVARNSGKLDLEHLFRDLSKYKPWLSATSWESWEQFMSTNLLNQEGLSWKLHSLVASAIRASQNQSEISPPLISDDTRELLAKETETPAQIVVRHPRRKQPAQSETDPAAGETMTEVQEGEMIAVYLPQYRDELPTIGKVVSINEDVAKVEVEWYVGSYTGVWRVCTQRKGRATVPWRETIPKESILFPVNFTKSLRLSKSFIIKLKEAYKNKL